MEENIGQPIIEEKTTKISRKKVLIIVLVLVLVFASVFFYVKYSKKVNTSVVENKSEVSQLQKTQNNLEDLLKKRADIETNHKNTIDSFNKEVIGINTKLTDLIPKIIKEKDIQALSLLRKEEADFKSQKIVIEYNIKKENADYEIKTQMVLQEINMATSNISSIQKANIEVQKNEIQLKNFQNVKK